MTKYCLSKSKFRLAFEERCLPNNPLTLTKLFPKELAETEAHFKICDVCREHIDGLERNFKESQTII